MKKRLLPLVALLVLVTTVFPLEAATPRRAGPRGRPRRPPLGLVWHVETLDGEVVDSNNGDEPINPASVVKVATSWWALAALGPDHRYETRFLARGAVDAKRGVLDGDLVVDGSGDPDFQAENAFLVAAALNRLDVRTVTGSLVVNGRFWMGWEDGSAGRQRDPEKRGELMALRLRQAMDPKRWNRVTRASWQAYADRRGLRGTAPPRVAIRGAHYAEDDPGSAEVLLVHRSKPLADTLRRFNCFSNNDMERVGDGLGPPGELERRLAEAIAAPPDVVRLETTSGLGENRISPRLVVRMMREFRRTGERLGRKVESLLPVAGCDPGTVPRFFPQFTEGANATALVAKTGTLTATDGGVSVLAGFLNTARGELVFCVAVPRASGRLRRARGQEESWLLALAAKNGGAQPRQCAPPLGGPDDEADVVLTAPVAPVAGPSSASAAPVGGAGGTNQAP